ncbi:MAG: GNAT family N-acetyltransferase [Acidobacteriota bacterium]|jgi:GNAT superfamily N-acetyltransferase
MNAAFTNVVVRNTTPSDFQAITELTRNVYPSSPSWTEGALASHLRVFPEGQFVAVETLENGIVGMSASLIILWDDYEMEDTWRDFTDGGMFTNHDPKEGHTLYGAEVMVAPGFQGKGIGKRFYAARRDLVRRLGLLRIRAGARLRGYHRHAGTLTPEEYVRGVIRGGLGDPTLSFQLKEGFEVIRVVKEYLRNDPESLGYAAVIEWLNPAVAGPEHYAAQPHRYRDARSHS